jgi:hypothetical protein
MGRQLLGHPSQIAAGGSIAFARKLNKLVELDCRQRGLLDGAVDQISRLDAATLSRKFFARRDITNALRPSTSAILSMIARTLRPSFISAA